MPRTLAARSGAGEKIEIKPTLRSFCFQAILSFVPETRREPVTDLEESLTDDLLELGRDLLGDALQSYTGEDLSCILLRIGVHGYRLTRWSDVCQVRTFTGPIIILDNSYKSAMVRPIYHLHHSALREKPMPRENPRPISRFAVQDDRLQD